MCQYFSKTEDQYAKAMKQPAKEAFENNMHHQDTMKAIRTGYLTLYFAMSLNGQTHFKNLAANAARFLKHV